MAEAAEDAARKAAVDSLIAWRTEAEARMAAQDALIASLVEKVEALLAD